MHQSKRFGCQVYPLLFWVTLAVPGLIAQNPTDSSSSSQGPSQAQTAPENPQQNQIRLAQEAQARIHARRSLRKQHVVQDTYSHKFEVYGGGAYTRFRPGSSLQHNNEGAWNAGFTDYRWPRIGITVDFRGYYGIAFIPPNPYNLFQPNISQYTFMAGPQYRILSREHWAISGQVLAGLAKANFYGNDAEFPGTLLGLWSTGISATFAAGVPVDYNLGPGLAIRLQPGYWLTTFSNTPQIKNLGFTTGVVYRFGRR